MFCSLTHPCYLKQYPEWLLFCVYYHKQKEFYKINASALSKWIYLFLFNQFFTHIGRVISSSSLLLCGTQCFPLSQDRGNPKSFNIAQMALLGPAYLSSLVTHFPPNSFQGFNYIGPLKFPSIFLLITEPLQMEFLWSGILCSPLPSPLSHKFS